MVGIGTWEGYHCPLTQYHFADALGLSAVHVNRALRQLREAGLLTFRAGRVTLDDRKRLIDLAGSDPSSWITMGQC